MTSILLDKINELELTSIDPEERFITDGVSWEQYEIVLSTLEANSQYRLNYLDGILEIMSPSRRHEVTKKNIGRLLEVYFEEKRIPFWALGSTTFRNQGQKAGKEPDECYCIGTEKELPDLAIEVIVTSGGIDNLKIYQRLGIKEVWFWENQQFYVYLSQNDKYELVSHSQLLPDLDLNLIAQYVSQPNPLDAVIEFRQKVRGVSSQNIIT